MRIAFILTNVYSPYEGVARPFINWAKELSKRDNEVHFITLRCGTKLTNFILLKLTSHGINLESARNIVDVIYKIKEVNPDVVMTDDSIDRLRLITNVKNSIGAKTAIYVQVLFGIHSIADVFDLRYLSLRDKLMYSVVKAIPFVLLKRTYKNSLARHDVLIANSKTTALLLSILYGVEPHGIVHPPVDTEIFHPRNIEKKEQFTLYLGSHAGDTNEDLAKRIVKTILDYSDANLVLFGNKKLVQRLTAVFNKHSNRLRVLSGVADEELAKVYSESKLTICPQKWEMFGYVIAESIACGTPVLAFNTIGATEIIEQNKAGYLAYNSNALLEILKRILHNEITFSSLMIDPEKLPFSINNSTENLIRVLNNE